MSSKLVSIGTAARELDVSVDTIRRWNKRGLIKAVRDKNKKRLFNTEEIARLKKKMNGSASLSQFTVLKAGHVFEDASCIDLFAGSGGTALGFAHAGFTHTLLNEYDQSAVKTLEHNNKAFKLGWNIDSRDVREIDFSNMKAKVIQAGFPCQAFSYAGKSKGFDDTRGTLFFEFARAIKAAKPIIAIGENVRGLVRHDKGKTLKTMLLALDELEYRVNFRVLRSQYLDVPQKRAFDYFCSTKRYQLSSFVSCRERLLHLT